MVSFRVCTVILVSIVTQVLLATTANPVPVVINNKASQGQDSGDSKDAEIDGADSNVLDIHNAAAWSFNTRSEDDEEWSWNKHTLGEDDQYTKSAKVIQVISYIVIALVLLSFAAFLICLCCPVCILSKMRQRRNGRTTVAYSGQSATPLTHVTTGNTLPSQSPNGPQMIAITNDRPTNSPYPVQQSVTLVMLAPTAYNSSQHAHVNYNQGLSYQPQIQMMPNQGNPMDLPPPYPGHQPKLDSGPAPSQLPYNPYYTGPEAARRIPGQSPGSAPPYSAKK